MCPLHLGCQNKGRHPQDCQRARPIKWHSIDSGTGSVGNIHVCLWLSWVFPFIRWWAFDAFAHCWLLVKLSKLSSFYGLYNGTHGKYQDCYGVKFLGLNPWRELYSTKRQKILFVAPLGFYLFIYSKKKEKSYHFSRYHHSWAISRYHLSGTISHGIAGQLCKPTDSQNEHCSFSLSWWVKCFPIVRPGTNHQSLITTNSYWI